MITTFKFYAFEILRGLLFHLDTVKIFFYVHVRHKLYMKKKKIC